MVICSKTNYKIINVKSYVSFQVDVVDVKSFNCDLPKAPNRRRATVSSQSYIFRNSKFRNATNAILPHLFSS